jgi:hypothetical protein
MKLTINGIECPADRVTYVEHGFGRTSRSPDNSPFECEMTHEEFRRAVESRFEKFTREMKADAENVDDDPVEELHEIGYPSFDQIMSIAPQRLIAVLIGYMRFELLEGLFGENDIYSPYVVYTLTDIVIGSQSVAVRGRVRW